MFRTILLTAAALTMAAIEPSAASNCMRRGQVDQKATQAWQSMQGRADPDFMAGMAGVWYSEANSPQTGQVSKLYQIFAENGIFDYRNEVCSNGGFCSTYDGTGEFAGFMLDGSQFTMMINVSDLNRNHECIGSSGQIIDGRTIQDSSGGVWRKVR